MAATIAIAYPTLAPGYEPYSNVDVLSIPVTSGDTVNDGDVLIMASGYVNTGATNPASALAGLALHASGAVYAPPASGATPYNTPFGTYTNTNTALVPGEPLNMHFAAFHNGARFEFSLDTSVALTQSLVGTSVGLKWAGAGNPWYVTNASSPNAVATVVGIAQGPGLGVIGTDSGGRLIVEFIASTLGI